MHGSFDKALSVPALGQLFPWARAGLLRHGRRAEGELDVLRRDIGLALTGYAGVEWPEIDLLLAEAVRNSGTGLTALVAEPVRDLPVLYLFTLASAIELDLATSTLLADIQPVTTYGWLRVGNADALLVDLFPDAPALDIVGCDLARHRLLLFDGVGPAVRQQVYTSGDYWHALVSGRLPAELRAIDAVSGDPGADGLGAGQLRRAAAALEQGQGIAVHSDADTARIATAFLALLQNRRPVVVGHEDWRQRSLRAVTRYAGWLPLVDCREHEGLLVDAAEIRRQAVLLLRSGQQMPEHYQQLPLPDAEPFLRRRWWRRCVGEWGAVETLACARLGHGAIERIGEQLAAGVSEGVSAARGGDDDADLLRRVRLIRTADASSHLRRVAQPVDTHCTDAMLVLTPDTAAALERCHRRCLSRDYADLGMGGTIRATADSGVMLLFSGASGTGKTLAGAWLATRLGAPLYRIDLAMVMNKYVGETEKNLSLALDEAAKADIMLLFDEADALFGKRSDSGHGGDRFANMLTNFLLTRIESHPGICVLTTNAGNRMDSAFVRRIHVSVEFKPLDAEQRLTLWQRLLAGREPGGDLCRRIARHCDLAPGHVRNIVVNACCWYPDQQPLTPAALWQAIDEEYRKASRAMPSQLMALRDRSGPPAPDGGEDAGS